MPRWGEAARSRHSERLAIISSESSLKILELDDRYLPGVLGVEWDEAHPGGSNAASTSMSEPSETPPLFDIMVTVISDRVELMPAQCTVAALRQISTHVHDQFSHAPRIGIVAAASGCGKSTLRKTLEATVAIPWHSHNASPADICRVIDRNPRTSIFIEEAENLDWSRGSLMRAIADACYECDGEIDRVDNEGNPYKFRIFCPFVWVLRGSRDDMPMAVQSRSFVMMMKKGRPADTAAQELSRRSRSRRDAQSSRSFCSCRSVRCHSAQSRPANPRRALSRSSPRGHL